MSDFSDLLDANARYANPFDDDAPTSVRKGLAILTCMDQRLDPLAMFGLRLGDAVVLRTPGGHLDKSAHKGLIAGVGALGATRICVVRHTRCAMAAPDNQAMIDRIKAATGADTSAITFGVQPDQIAGLKADIETLQADPLISDHADVAGFLYATGTARLTQIC